MPANIDSMAYTGEVPWHTLGTRLDNPMTAEQAITAGGLDWEVAKEPLYLDDDRKIAVQNHFVIRRQDRWDAPGGGQLGVVGRNYTPLQNKQAFSFLDPVVGDGEAVYHTVGSLDGGRRIWLLAKLPGEIRVANEDITEKYLLLSNSHDGTSVVRILFTPIRVVCQNTLNMALADNSGLAIRHYPCVLQRVTAAYRLLGVIHQAYDRAAISMQAMTTVQMTGNRLRNYFELVLPTPRTDEQQQNLVQLRHQRWAQLFCEGIGNTMPGVRGSLWAAYNGVTQWVDRESYTTRLKEPLKSIWFGSGRRLKERAFSMAERLLAAPFH